MESNGRKIDLTYPIHEGMVTFPVHWHPLVEITQLGRHGIEDRETRKITIGSHTGTHCDAPLHFIKGGQSIDVVSLDILIGPAYVVDFTEAEPFQELNIGDFKEKLGDRSPERLVMQFGWAKRWGKLDYYTDHPFISEAAAAWLVDRGVRLLGMDTPMPDNPENGWKSKNDSPNHKILLGKDVILLEYIANLEALTKRDVLLIVLPLKIEGADGAPARVVAIE